MRNGGYDQDDGVPFEFVAVRPSDAAETLAKRYRNRVFVHTVHDGGMIPRQFLVDGRGRPRVAPDALESEFVRERDWGANIVAHHLAGEMGVGGYGRVKLARVLLDFNRFPGITPPGNDDPLERLAINRPFSEALDHGSKLEVLERYYDRISDLMEDNIVDKLIIMGVHTYDEHNPSETKRPDVSLVSLPAGYQRESRMPYGVFDPLYPDVLGESTCSRILRDRISLNLERAGFRVSTNHPYALPEGSIEVRSQVWYFFEFLQKRYNAEFPHTRDEPAHRLVWTMLLNTNLRLERAEALRGYLHRLRRVAPADRELFELAQGAYERICEFLARSRVLKDYRRSADRPSSIALEVRKDLLCEVDPDTGRPRPRSGETVARAKIIAQVVAGAVSTFLETDRDEQRYLAWLQHAGS